MARKYKQVHRKEIDFDIKDWEKIERRAEACHTTTSKYLRQVILNAEPTFYDMREVAPLLNGMRIISNNINQIAKKVNETNNITADDVEKLRNEVESLSLILSQSLFTTPSKRV
jgi:hypothetical protein